ncbi:MAG: transposon-transfer assisting family protein [Clostridia bacterium]|nr:transposon-transfer assisting family protein [Clostridia bacterium]
MPEFQPDEMTLMALYDTGTREGLIASLKEMRPYMDEDEKALQDMTDAVLDKLSGMTDEQYSELMTNS